MRDLGGVGQGQPARIQLHDGQVTSNFRIQLLRTAEELAAGAAPFYLMGIAGGYRRLGLETDANRALDRYFESASNGPTGAADWAQDYLFVGDTDRASEQLRRAVEKIENGEADAGFIALQRS